MQVLISKGRKRTERVTDMIETTIDFTGTGAIDEMILYVAKQSECDRDFGAVKLQKILFRADFLHYAKYGRSISGGKYRKRDKGPVLSVYKPVETKLLNRGDVRIDRVERGPHIQKRLVALREPDLSRLTGAAIKIIDQAIASMAGMNAKDASDWSHNFVGWQLAGIGEEIPYQTIFVSGRRLTPKERARGLELAANRE